MKVKGETASQARASIDCAADQTGRDQGRSLRPVNVFQHFWRRFTTDAVVCS
jgi:hypothetical protein